MKRWVLITLIVLGLGAVVVIVGFYQINIDALQEPGHLETTLATQAKRILVHRSSRDGIPPAPTDQQASIEEGDKLFGADCAACHGLDGHTPTDAGRWMYPRAADLTSPEVQQYSDRELFWIVKNGIRLSGMPAFGRVESDEHIWDLSEYVRTLRSSTGDVRRKPSLQESFKLNRKDLGPVAQLRWIIPNTLVKFRQNCAGCTDVLLSWESDYKTNDKIPSYEP